MRYLLMAMFFYYNIAFGQFLNKANKWNDLVTMVTTGSCKSLKCGGRYNFTHSYFLSNDTLINGRNYTLLMDSVFSRSSSYYHKAGYLREEDKKIYFYDQHLKRDILIYDFKLKTNDTFNINSAHYHVFHTDSINYLGTKRYTLKLKSSSDSMTWIDGIGAKENFAYYRDRLSYNMLLCFKQDNILKYKNGFGKDCIDTLVDFGDAVNEYLEHHLKVYPNPTSDYLTVNCERRIFEIDLLDISGRLIHRFLPNSYSYLINMTSFQSGFYFVKVNDTVLKIIKK